VGYVIETQQAEKAEWQQTACILCECNCGIEVRLGEGGAFERIRGDKAHPGSQGYTCEKALRLAHYQGGRDRVMQPLRRREDGTYEEVSWDIAISEIAARFKAVREEHGGESIFYYGGGGQGNHLGGSYAGATMRALGARYRSNALAQEKTGEFWVNQQMLGTMVRSDLEHSEVALFVGKNPWQSHGFPRARTTLKEIANDPARCLIVIDPRRSETADIADVHLQPRPGTDAWLIAGLLGVLVDEGLLHRSWLAEHAVGLDEVMAVVKDVDVARCCSVSGVDEMLVRETARRIGRASSVGVFEDLGVQMNRHSTLVSYLEKLVWLLTGNYGNPGGQYAPTALVSIARQDREGSSERSPVSGARIISGLVPCNVVAEEILTDHPARYRAMLIESANPARSLADSPRMREAIDALEFVVVIDVFMTETARMADYVLPSPTQYEKHEATFFNFDFPKNVFHLRRPVVPAPEGPLPEPEIHARLGEALGAWTDDDLAPLRAALESGGRPAFGVAFMTALAGRPDLAALAPLLIYRVLGPTLPDGAASAAILWAAAYRCVATNAESCARAGFADGEALFDAILNSPSGVVITDDEYDASWRRMRTDDGLVHLVVPELLSDVATLSVTSPSWLDDPEWPFILSAGERRSFTANTIIRDPAWRKKDPAGALRLAPADAAALGVVDGDSVRVTTPRGSAVAVAEVNDRMQPGHISLPNGMGLDHPSAESGETVVTGVAPNELTGSFDRDPFAGTPWHKSVPARLERVG
jgi:anaerobic selenocysteine-containing dehydrogenase